VAAVKKSAQVDLPVNRLAERFEEMARRQGAMVDAELRPSIVKLLAAELWANQRALDIPGERLLSGTLHQGAIAPELLKEFPEHPRYVIISAIENHPAGPREYIRRVGQEIEALSSEPEFQRIAIHRPSEITMAVIYAAPSKVREELRRRVVKAGYSAESGPEKG